MELKERLERISKHFEEITDEEFDKNLKEAGFEVSKMRENLEKLSNMEYSNYPIDV
ncbi:hypothetical protein ACS2Q2_26330 [Bacillus cereus group sp. Bce009]|uniref:hypothetical protein n=1 Tax=Bacillus cereus group TaxID=86661 RepID=UPI0024072858|nr:hypothetical protein [Bacillus cereus]MDF9644306.1 hypothetical protein [Bacillus cereus]